ncbi:hypothetical protein CLV24_11987 [Pontibacter ummariensis]|uniref:DUF6371 domain-containing protein n=1 Tax=Pontibacter ummariensis TaxID=1610492 RepID=A0A239IZ87_9BACT|nr:DUF6371 domain-containing protein [Pontibacter ummariensis]PRY09036.1 hypothetical protein CLV24_11987 [Pontibacter ummariensis]SNS98845.1 hypothetical protein SAMN06296052_11987 [Pontibacter ummariensis]
MPPKPASTIDPSVFRASLSGYASNRFTVYLADHFGYDIASQLIERYFIGTSKYWDGATVFWQIDNTGCIRSGKIMLYNPVTGKRSKDTGKYPTWVHTALKLKNFNLKQCFFGEHLLQVEKGKPVAVVESEKTAIIASVYLPQFTWLATGGKGGLNAEKCLALQGRKVVLFPDLNAFDSWKCKAMELSGIAAFTLSELLEKKATEDERAQGLDLADYLIRFNHRTFIDSAASQPDRVLDKEHYHYSYKELTEAYGEEEALKKVQQYAELSKQYQSCKNFVVHNCPLLQSYNQLQHEKAAVSPTL